MLRHTPAQFLEHLHYLEWMYLRQTKVMHKDPRKILIIRTVMLADAEQGRGCSVSSIADVLQQPRLTVRRKSLELVKEGWLIRQHNILTLGPRVTPKLWVAIDDNIDQMMTVASRMAKLGKDCVAASLLYACCALFGSLCMMPTFA